VTVGPEGLPGYQHVVHLAHVLVGLRSAKALSEKAAERVVEAYNRLSAFDKRAITFNPRHRQHYHGRFRAKGQSKVGPGVVATER
jgi:hypothetical protein